MKYIYANTYLGIKFSVGLFIIITTLEYLWLGFYPYHIILVIEVLWFVILSEFCTWVMRHNGWVIDYDFEKFRHNRIIEEINIYFKIIFKVCRFITKGEYYYLKVLEWLWIINQSIAFLFWENTVNIFEAILGLFFCFFVGIKGSKWMKRYYKFP